MPDLNASSDDIVLVAIVADIGKLCLLMIQGRSFSATDALAYVEGFRIMVHLTFSHLFQMNCCQNCPECNCSPEPCQDMCGSNAKAEGGILGRVDAMYTSIEAQTSTGSLHAHSQVFVQCLHQHTCVPDRCYKKTLQAVWRSNYNIFKL